MVIFDVLGTMNARGLDALPDVQEPHAFCQAPATIERLRPDGWAAAIWKPVERGEIAEERCPAMMRDYISLSLDTTIFAIGSLLSLGRNPDQWELVRSDPALIPSASGRRLVSHLRCCTTVSKNARLRFRPMGCRLD